LEFIAKGGRKFFDLLNTVVALYGLLPTSIKVSDSIDNVAVKIKRDKRFFIVVDGNVLLMTKFLEKIESLIKRSSIQDKPLRGFEKNLKDILNT
jgi:hypothetical protein